MTSATKGDRLAFSGLLIIFVPMTPQFFPKRTLWVRHPISRIPLQQNPSGPRVSIGGANP